MILYKANDKVSIKLLAKDLEITSEREPKHIHFGIFVEINNQNDKLRLGFKDFDKVYIKDKKAFEIENVYSEDGINQLYTSLQAY